MGWHARSHVLNSLAWSRLYSDSCLTEGIPRSLSLVYPHRSKKTQINHFYNTFAHFFKHWEAVLKQLVISVFITVLLLWEETMTNTIIKIKHLVGGQLVYSFYELIHDYHGRGHGDRQAGRHGATTIVQSSHLVQTLKAERWKGCKLGLL